MDGIKFGFPTGGQVLSPPMWADSNEDHFNKPVWQEEIELIICNQCGYAVATGLRFCTECGAELARVAGSQTHLPLDAPVHKFNGDVMASGVGNAQQRILPSANTSATNGSHSVSRLRFIVMIGGLTGLVFVLGGIRTWLRLTDIKDGSRIDSVSTTWSVSSSPAGRVATNGTNGGLANSGYTLNRCGSITDNSTKLEWYVGANQNVTWDQANTWIRDLSACGERWRMPTVIELKSLYKPGATAGTGYYARGRFWPAHIDPMFNGIGGGSWVWANEIIGDRNARSFNFNQGVAVDFSRNDTTYSTRAFAVR